MLFNSKVVAVEKYFGKDCSEGVVGEVELNGVC